MTAPAASIAKTAVARAILANSYNFVGDAEMNVAPAAAASAVAPVAKPKKKATKSGQPKKAKATGPTMREMVLAACQSAAAAAKAEGGPGSRKGISSQAIKKFLLETYGVDTSSASKNSHIRKALVAAVESGVLLQTKGVGASGSFRLAATAVKPKKAVAKKQKEAKDPTGEPKKVMVKPKAKETVATTAKPKKAVMKTTTTKGKKSATPVKAAKVKKAAAGKNVEKKAISPKVIHKVPKARKSPKVTAPKKAKTVAVKK